MKFKYKTLIAFTLTAIFLIALQTAMQFMTSYHWVGFEKKDGSWYGIAQKAQADSYSVQQQLDQCMQDKHDAILNNNPDLQ